MLLSDEFRLRVFARLDPEAFTAGFLRWTQAVREENQTATLPVIAVDGKTLRHNFAGRQIFAYFIHYGNRQSCLWNFGEHSS